MRLSLVCCASATLILAACETTAASGQGAGFLSVSGRGASGWTLECSISTPGGGSRTPRIRGMSDERTYLNETRASAATCRYQASANGPFDLLVNTEDFACPFPAADSAKCERSVPAGEAGEFALMLKP